MPAAKDDHAKPAEPKDDYALRAAEIPCCPELSRKPCCDRLQFDYRLTHQVRDVAVEVTIEAEIERCPGPLSLGDLVYSTTLFPGERVRLFTSSRKNRFTFDSESQVSYRHEQTSEESYFMSSMSQFMTDIDQREQIDQETRNEGSFESSGSVPGTLEKFFSGGTKKVNGRHNGASSLDFTRELSTYARGSHDRSVEATRAASSVSIGEVQSRSHAEGESESTFEASTRTLHNPNRCHAVTYFAYQIDKRQTVRFKIRAVRRRVVDPAGDSKVALQPPVFAGDVAVIPQAVLATSADRVAVESTGRASGVADRAAVISSLGDSPVAGRASFFDGRLLTARELQGEQAFRGAARTATREPEPLAAEVRAEALRKVDEDLVAAGLLDKVGGQLTADLAQELSFEVTTCLPTPALLIKGCLDECNVCEDTLQRQIELELDRQELENRLLARQIELLDKAQAYRCCPAGETEPAADGDA